MERLSPSFSEEIIDHTCTQTMLYLTCTMLSSVDLAHYAVSHAKDWVSVDCNTIFTCIMRWELPEWSHDFLLDSLEEEPLFKRILVLEEITCSFLEKRICSKRSKLFPSNVDSPERGENKNMELLP